MDQVVDQVADQVVDPVVDQVADPAADPAADQVADQFLLAPPPIVEEEEEEDVDTLQAEAVDADITHQEEVAAHPAVEDTVLLDPHRAN